ncbi:hypothetical protein BCR42DRAFT_492591, partial [Absidia repens]
MTLTGFYLLPTFVKTPRLLQQHTKIGRPINCFMAFRLEKHREISSQSPGLNHRDISKIIAKWWKEATDIEKAPYRAIAEKAKAEHAKKNLNVKYDLTIVERMLLHVNKSPMLKRTFENNGLVKKTMKKQTAKAKPLFTRQVPAAAVALAPMFYDNFIYDNEMIPTDAISDCTLPSSQFNTVDLVPEFSSLELFNIPDYVNLQMLSLDNSSFIGIHHADANRQIGFGEQLDDNENNNKKMGRSRADKQPRFLHLNTRNRDAQLESHIDYYHASTLPPSLVDWTFQLTKKNLHHLYVASNDGWSESGKKAELQAPEARYLVARSTQDTTDLK